MVLVSPSNLDVARARTFANGGGVTLAVLPSSGFSEAFGATQAASVTLGPTVLKYQSESQRPWTRLRTLHDYDTFHQVEGTTVLSDTLNRSVWLWLPLNHGGILFVGTDLAGDLIQYRQGDPTRETARPSEVYWGVVGERPNYLFEAQRKGESPQERHADWWAMALAECLSSKLGQALLPVLPGGAPGAVIITGDDDQADLEKYSEQIQLLGTNPITYFLHHLTRHSSKTLKEMLGRPTINLGIHPDALDAPQLYTERLADQVRWYRSLIGKSPVSLRNHGFLNDGYWRQLPSWLRQNIRISSNLPGLDGNVLNGSLLPARVAYRGTLTAHWSLLTAFGDGMIFALKMSDEEAASRIQDFASCIVASGIPGIIVLNLHPQNVTQTRCMHRSAIQVIQSGFLGWTMLDCLNWFTCRDEQASVIGTKSNRFLSFFTRRIRTIW